MRRKCKWNDRLKKEFPFLEKADHKNDETGGVYCRVCKSTFSISNSGRSRINLHLKSKKHTEAERKKGGCQMDGLKFAGNGDGVKMEDGDDDDEEVSEEEGADVFVISSKRRKCRWNDALAKEFPFLEKKDYKGDKRGGAFCKLCLVTFSISNGRHSITSHMKSGKHIHAERDAVTFGLMEGMVRTSLPVMTTAAAGDSYTESRVEDGNGNNTEATNEFFVEEKIFQEPGSNARLIPDETAVAVTDLDGSFMRECNVSRIRNTFAGKKMSDADKIMARRKCRWNDDLAKEFPFLKSRRHKGDGTSGVYCTICETSFSIANSGRTKIRAHLQSQKHLLYEAQGKSAEHKQSRLAKKSNSAAVVGEVLISEIGQVTVVKVESEAAADPPCFDEDDKFSDFNFEEQAEHLPETGDTDPVSISKDAPEVGCFVCGRIPEAPFKTSLKLYSIFLKELLSIPDDKTTRYLQQLRAPKKWIKFCGSCRQVVEESAIIRDNITELEKQLKNCKRQIANRMKKTITILNVDEGQPSRMSHQFELDILDAIKSHQISSPQTLSNKANRALTNDSDLHRISKTESPLATDLQACSVMLQRVENQNSNNLYHCGDCIDDKVFVGEAELVTHKNTVHSKNGYNRHSSEFLDEDWIADDDSHQEPNYSECGDGDGNSIQIRTPKKPKGKDELGFIPDGAYAKMRYDCVHCPNIRNYSAVDYAYHISIHQRRPHKCSICLELICTTTEMELHFREKHGDLFQNDSDFVITDKFITAQFGLEEIWKCFWCRNGFQTEDGRDTHEISCSSRRGTANQNGKTKECSSCFKTFRNFSEWRIHRVVEHPEVDELSCPYCSLSLAEMTKKGVAVRHHQRLCEHVRTVHKTSKIVDGCDICGEIFVSMTSMRLHVVTKHGVPLNKIYSCRFCENKSFSTRVDLHRHMKHNHFERESLVCDTCGMKFLHSFSLVDHKVKEHDFEPREDFYVRRCSREGCSFKTVIGRFLARHVKVAHEGFRYKCKICGKEWKDPRMLSKHTKTHVDKEIRPYQCELCGKSYAVREYLNIHRRVTHEGKLYPSVIKKRQKRGNDL